MDVYLPPGNFLAESPRQELKMIVPSPLSGVPLAQCFCLLQEPQPQHPTWHFQIGPSARLEHQGSCGAPSSQNTHIHDVPQGVNSYIWATRRNLGQSVSMLLQEIVQHVFFHRGYFSPSSLSLEVFFHWTFDKENKEDAKIIFQC